jgi:hypothetical protein
MTDTAKNILSSFLTPQYKGQLVTGFVADAICKVKQPRKGPQGYAKNLELAEPQLKPVQNLSKKSQGLDRFFS